jgi:hypothetical protein
MNRFQIWWLYLLTGRWGKKTFDFYIRKLQWHAYHQQLDKLPPHDAAVWQLPELQAYFIFQMRHDWLATIAGGGASIKIANKKRREAIAELMTISPRATVMYIDDTMKFIFYKVTE